MTVREHEIVEALAAFNAVRAKVGGIKTYDEQVEAMTAALDAAHAVRKMRGEQE